MKFLIPLFAILAFASFEAANAFDGCVICQKLAGLVQASLESGAAEREVEDLVSDYCKTLPTVVEKGKCHLAALAIIPQVFHFVEKDLKNVTFLCHKLSLCSATQQQFGEVNMVESLKPNVKANPECVVCEFVMNELDSMLTKNATQHEIEAALDRVCSYLPSTVRSDCVTFVDTYAPEVLKLLAQEIKPSYICTLLKLCTGTNSFGARGRNSLEDGGVCAACTTVVEDALKVLSKKSTDAEVEQDLLRVCAFLSGAMRTGCQEAVKSYVPEFIRDIEHLKPKMVCQKLKLCAQ